MKDFDRQWRKLTELARQAPAPSDTLIPPGFATRVAAQAAGAPPGAPWALLERLAFRGLLAATLCCAVAMVFSYWGNGGDQIEDLAADDSVVALLDIS